MLAQLDDNGNEQMVVSAFPSGSGVVFTSTMLLTQAQYDALAVKDVAVMYVIVG